MEIKQMKKKTICVFIILFVVTMLSHTNVSAAGVVDKMKELFSDQKNQAVVKVKGRIVFNTDRLGEKSLCVLSEGAIKLVTKDAMNGCWYKGEKLLCELFPVKSHGIVIINQDGSTEKVLISRKDSILGDPSCSRQGDKILFSSTLWLKPQRKNEATNLFIMDFNGTHLKQLTFEEKESIFNPKLSPDGKKIVFNQGLDRENPNSRFAIFTMRSDGSRVKQLTDNPDGDSDPAWSPDGKLIVFASWRKDNKYRQIYIMNADGSNVRRITSSPFSKAQPCWSPDGKQIAFVGYRHGLQFAYSELFVINIDGTGEGLLLPPAKVGKVWATDSHPDWTW